MKKLLIILSFALALAVASCSDGVVGADAITRAENAVSSGHMGRAQSCADSIMTAHADCLDGFTPSQLCRLALVYKKLADNTLTTEDANTASALKLYKLAFSMNADSVIVFRRSLTLDDAAAFEVLSSLHMMSTAPVDLGKEEPLDSMGLGVYEESAISR